MRVEIFVATHKKYAMPKNKIYIPLHVGKYGKHDLGYQGDDIGENISYKNNNYCELTGLFWMWKNVSCDYIGLCHYRRYFINKNILTKMICRNKMNLLLNKNEITKIMNSYDIILPQKMDFGDDTIRIHYEKHHNIDDMNRIEAIIKSKYSQYVEPFQKVMSDKKMYTFNMFIMKKEDFNRYCNWLFDILFQLEKEIDITKYDSYQQRIYGFISERLFNVWILNEKFNIKEIETINIEENSKKFMLCYITNLFSRYKKL